MLGSRNLGFEMGWEMGGWRGLATGKCTFHLWLVLCIRLLLMSLLQSTDSFCSNSTVDYFISMLLKYSNCTQFYYLL